jgi:hypothetical protein
MSKLGGLCTPALLVAVLFWVVSEHTLCPSAILNLRKG